MSSEPGKSESSADDERASDSPPKPARSMAREDSPEVQFQTAADGPVPGFWKEFASFLWHSPSWWLAPLIIMLVLLGLAVTMIPAEAMPFIYTLW